MYCEIICDGRHLHPGTVRFIIKIKGLNRVVAVTDSIMAAGLPDGSYKLGVNDVVVVDGDAKLASDGTRVYDRVGSIEPGKDADLVFLDEDCQVVRTLVKGKVCYTKDR